VLDAADRRLEAAVRLLGETARRASRVDGRWWESWAQPNGLSGTITPAAERWRSDRPTLLGRAVPAWRTPATWAQRTAKSALTFAI
jgi:hypothetical protein